MQLVSVLAYGVYCWNTGQSTACGLGIVAGLLGVGVDVFLDFNIPLPMITFYASWSILLVSLVTPVWKPKNTNDQLHLCFHCILAAYFLLSVAYEVLHGKTFLFALVLLISFFFPEGTLYVESLRRLAVLAAKNCLNFWQELDTASFIRYSTGVDGLFWLAVLYVLLSYCCLFSLLRSWECGVSEQFQSTINISFCHGVFAIYHGSFVTSQGIFFSLSEFEWQFRFCSLFYIYKTCSKFCRSLHWDVLLFS